MTPNQVKTLAAAIDMTRTRRNRWNLLFGFSAVFSRASNRSARCATSALVTGARHGRAVSAGEIFHRHAGAKSITASSKKASISGAFLHSHFNLGGDVRRSVWLRPA